MIKSVQMNIGKKGKKVYLDGWNCAEAIARVASAEKLAKLSGDTVRSTSVFGSGMAGTGEICGALCGALMVLSAKEGRMSQVTTNDQLYEKARVLIEKFREANGSISCREITKKFRKRGTFQTPERRQSCSEIIKTTLNELAQSMEDDRQG